MALLLSIETATKVCSVALHRENVLLGCQDIFLEKSHSTLLNVLIDDLFKYCDAAKTELSAVAVSKGPGSYTGLRIGTSTAKGICYGLDIPLIGVNTLEAMGRGCQHFNYAGSWLCPMIDARRMEVYCLVMDAEGNIIHPCESMIIDEHAFESILKNQMVLFFGNGAPKSIPVLEKNKHAQFIEDFFPSAKWVGEIGMEKFNKGEFEDIAYFTPYYLKEFRTTQPKKGKSFRN